MPVLFWVTFVIKGLSQFPVFLFQKSLRENPISSQHSIYDNSPGHIAQNVPPKLLKHHNKESSQQSFEIPKQQHGLNF